MVFKHLLIVFFQFVHTVIAPAQLRAFGFTLRPF